MCLRVYALVCMRVYIYVCEYMCMCIISAVSLPLIALLSYSGSVTGKLSNSNFTDTICKLLYLY